MWWQSLNSNDMKDYILTTPNDIEQNLINLKQLVFEVTDACNLRCKYCGYADLYEGYDKRENTYFPFKRAKLIIDYLYNNYWKKKTGKGYTRTINIGFYGGEPLLNMPFIKEVIAYIENLPYIGITFKFGMTTNAMLLDRYMDYLVEKDFFILISLDGNEEGQSYRVDASGNNSFHRVIKNVRKLSKSYPAYFKDKVMFNSVLHNRNSVESTYTFIKEEFDKVTSFSALNTTDVRRDKIEEFNRMYKNVAQDLNCSSKCGIIEQEMFINAPQTARLLDYLRTYSGNFYQSYVNLLMDKNNLKQPLTATCTPFMRKLFVTVNGKILQCEKINHDFAVGLVTNDEVTLDLKQAAELHNRYTSTYIKECKTCAIRKNCKRCVYMFGNPLNDKKCYSYMTSDELQAEKETSLRYLEERNYLYDKILSEVIIRE